MLFGKEKDGLDNNGVFLDTLSSFWSSIYESCTCGKEERVPVIRHDFQVAECESIARILVKGYKQVNFPVKLNKAFISASVFSERAVTDEPLIECFLVHLSKDESQLVNLALNKALSEEQEDEWLELLGQFECKSLLNADKAKDLVLEIAHKEFIQIHRYIVDCWHTPLVA